jgi:MFS family permease
MSLGGVLGAYLASKLGQGAKGRIIIAGILVEMVCYAALAITRSYWLILVTLFISGIDGPAMLVPVGAIFQEYTPSALRGRVFTVRSTLFSAIMAASMGIGPWLSSVVGMRSLFGILAAGLLAIGTGAALSRTVKETK